MISKKYCTRSLSVLTDEEIMMESKLPKTKFTVDLFAEDVDFAQENNLNLSRIIRFKFHEWLNSKKKV